MSNDEEDFDDDEDSDDSEEIEPRLKYRRLQNDLVTILVKDAASCLSAHSKFLALGTHWGMIYIIDHCGNNISGHQQPAHTTTVNQISIDDNGDYIASCSDDGRVVISGFYSQTHNQVINMDRPIKSVAIDPCFYKPSSGRHFITGDDKLISNEKSMFGRKTTILHQGEGPIHNVKWKSNLIAWSNDTGVKVYDMISKRRISSIVRDQPQLRSDLYKCSLYWRDERTLLIGWANTIKVCVVKDKEKSVDNDLPNLYMSIVSMFTTEYMICGIAPYYKHLVILSCDIDEASNDVVAEGDRPHLCILDLETGDEITNDALSIHGFASYRCNDYHLECLAEENTYFIVSPKDIIEARRRDEDDHIAWLMERDMYEEAMASTSEHCKVLKHHTIQEVGKEYLDYLIDERRYEDAARLCVRHLGNNRQLWQREAFRFSELQQLKVLAAYLPRGEPTLSPAVYEMALNDFLQTDHLGFQAIIKDWPCNLYNIRTIINAVLDRLDREPTNSVLLQCLADLYIHEKRYDKALGIYLRIKHKDVFSLIIKHDLLTSVQDKLVLLMEFDSVEAVKMLLEYRECISVDKVVSQLEDHLHYLHMYLDSLFHQDKEAGKLYHSLQVKLYASYDRPRLLPFLKSSNYYALQTALNDCTERDLTVEIIFLLGRMGNTKKALQLITNQLGDVTMAIDFCKEHNDEELWTDIINYSIDKPSFITGLLRNIGTHVDPIRLITEIHEGMAIPGLRDSLVKILQDYNLQMSLRSGCRKILVSDHYNLFKKHVLLKTKAIRLDCVQVCQFCQERVLPSDVSFISNVIVFNCHHVFHEDCLPVENTEHCITCTAKRIKCI